MSDQYPPILKIPMVPTSWLIQVLEEQDEFLRRNARRWIVMTGLVVLALIVQVVGWFTEPPFAPICHEDEVAVAALPGEEYEGGMYSTKCIPLDDLICGPGVRLTTNGGCVR